MQFLSCLYIFIPKIFLTVLIFLAQEEKFNNKQEEVFELLTFAH